MVLFLNTKKKILITGSRAPVGLHLARLLNDLDHSIYTAESISRHLSKKSNAIEKNFLIPKPNDDYEGFISSLIKIIDEYNIDLIIPTSEETFHIAKSKSKLEKYCTVFTDDISKLEMLHNKWKFIQEFKKQGFLVPETWFFSSYKELSVFVNQLDDNYKFVLKPVYSRFASNTHILRKKDGLPSIEISDKKTWVLQEFIEGIQYCTYSIVHKGKIVAYTAYPTLYTAGLGANIYFKYEENQAIFNIADKFIKEIDFTGQISFDFIQTKDGKIYPLECNPRAISGLHLFSKESDIDKAFLDPNSELILPKQDNQSMLGSAMIIYGFLNGYIFKNFKDWIKVIKFSKDAIFSQKDIKPYFYQFVVIIDLFYRSLKHNKSLLEMTTEDIEWEGKE